MKKLITQEIISAVEGDLRKETSSVAPLKMQTSEMYAIGMIMVVKTGDTYYINVPDDLSKDYVSSWMKDVGKVFTRTLRKQRYDLLYELRSEEYKTILRRIEEDEALSMSENALDHVTIGDYAYVIIKRSPIKCPYSTYERDYDEVLRSLDALAGANAEDDKKKEKICDEDSGETMMSISLFD